MLYRKLLSIVLLICTIAAFSSCSDKSSVNVTDENEMDIFAMDTYMNLKAYGPNSEAALQTACDTINELEALFSVTKEGSDVYRLNNADGQTVTVSPCTTFLIQQSLQINNNTNGAFDITLYPISKDWGFTTGNYKVPSQARIDELLTHVGCENIILNTETNSVSLKNDANIDLGGIAKGYAGSQAAEVLKQEGVTSAILNMGGNVQTIGTKPDGSYWKVGIQDPNNSSLLIGSVQVADKAVITSGGYERYFQDDDGNIYWHIIDPKTGYPTNSGIISVTIIGTDGMTCDALSTSLFVMDIKEASQFLKSHREFDAIILLADKSLYVTDGIKDFRYFFKEALIKQRTLFVYIREQIFLPLPMSTLYCL